MRKGRRVMAFMALIALLPALCFYSAFGLPPQYARVYHAALCDKVELLAKTEGPRIVLIGGSGAAFNVDSGLLERGLPAYHVVNFGLYAGLGTAVMLELALPELRAGDIAVFMPELSEQTLSDWFDAEMLWQAAEERPLLLTRLDASRREALLAAFPRYAAQKARFCLTGGAPQGDGVYARSSFDGHGDIRAELRPANCMPGGHDAGTLPDFGDQTLTAGFVSRVNDFARACRQRDVRMFFRFCPVNASALTPGQLAQTEELEGRARGALSCELLGSVRRAVMDAGWFFDTNFHLNAAGAAMNTILLLEELKEALGDAGPLTVPRPAMPALEAVETEAGVDDDAGCFLYAPEGEGLAVVGLTDVGRTRTALTVPSHAQGLPVTSLRAGALSGTVSLRKLTLQANILSIADGAFAGCDELTEIILLKDDPGRCAVGTGLLSGTGAVITVPAACYGSYCTSYFWAVHASRLRPSPEATTAGSEVPPNTTAATAVLPPKTLVTTGPSALTRLNYHGNGGVTWGRAEEAASRELSYAHLRENTLQGTVWFHRDGYTLFAWNTAPDGSGIAVGLGSRYDLTDGADLYAQWLPWSPDTDFDWSVTDTGAQVTGYRGAGGVCVIPAEYGGQPVRGIAGGAFSGARFTLLLLPPSLRTIGEAAFTDCVFDTLALSDSLETVSDAGFPGCSLRTLRVNAAVSPAYSGSWFDTFQDKLDHLRSLRGRRKLILSSGSSGRYGYDSSLLAAAFPELSPANMGVYAYTNALPQLRLILPLTEAGDILLYAPEFDAVQEQFCVSDRLDAGFWAMMESDYDTVAALDLRTFSGVFDSFGEYQRVRRGMPKRSYEQSAANYDDDGNYYAFSTYDRYGDLVLPRPNGDTDGRLRHNIADYTLDSFPDGTVQALNAALRPFTERGVTVYFGYTPRNSASLTEKSTPDRRQALEQYLRDTLEVPVISRLEDSLMKGRYFWLIDSHLSSEGARLRTQQVISDLKAVMDREE